MYIIRTFKENVHIDFDELAYLKKEMAEGSKLIFFRQGAVNPSHIVAIVEDVERKSEIVKMSGDTDDSIEQRIREERSEDIFERFRNHPALESDINNLQLS